MIYRYKTLPSSFYIKNRKSFIDMIEDNSIAVFHSLDEYPISADGHLPFKQSSDLLYLSGIDQEETILMLTKVNGIHSSKLFIKKTDETIKIWEGEKLSLIQAKSISGIHEVLWLESFKDEWESTVRKVTHIYENVNMHKRAKREVATKDDRFSAEIRNNYPDKVFYNSFPVLENLRVQKKKPEIEALQKACDITKSGFEECLKTLKPGTKEYELEALFAYVVLKNGGDGFAYQPIIASGKNNCVLHYINNNQTCVSGDLVLMDVGASYANYCADMTRCVPVSGRFTKRQKEVYEAVLDIKNKSAELLVAGNTFEEYKKEVIKIVNSSLVQLGLIQKKDIVEKETPHAPYRKYFMHGISHQLGLDTHDYGLTEGKIKENMVLTVEPGIYIPQEGFGIRLEDDYLVKKTGTPYNLMQDIPIEVEEIEEQMS